jgi:hypothetical protein
LDRRESRAGLLIEQNLAVRVEDLDLGGDRGLGRGDFCRNGGVGWRGHASGSQWFRIASVYLLVLSGGQTLVIFTMVR